MYMQYWKNWQKKMEVLFSFSCKCQDRNLHVPYVLLSCDPVSFVSFFRSIQADMLHEGLSMLMAMLQFVKAPWKHTSIDKAMIQKK